MFKTLFRVLPDSFFFLPDSFNKKRRIVFEPLASPKLDLGKEKMFYFYFMERTSSK